MEDKDSKNKKNLENWKTVNFDFASLYPGTMRIGRFWNIYVRKIRIKKIWEL